MQSMPPQYLRSKYIISFATSSGEADIICHRQTSLTKKGHLCGTLRKEGATVIFAKGELYCYAVIFGLRPSYIRFASFWGEYNITETASFNITLRDNAKYHCETCLTISLNILIFEIG